MRVRGVSLYYRLKSAKRSHPYMHVIAADGVDFDDPISAGKYQISLIPNYLTLGAEQRSKSFRGVMKYIRTLHTI